jgi:hypothetical protein
MGLHFPVSRLGRNSLLPAGPPRCWVGRRPALPLQPGWASEPLSPAGPDSSTRLGWDSSTRLGQCYSPAGPVLFLSWVDTPRPGWAGFPPPGSAALHRILQADASGPGSLWPGSSRPEPARPGSPQAEAPPGRRAPAPRHRRPGTAASLAGTVPRYDAPWCPAPSSITSRPAYCWRVVDVGKCS